MLNQTKQLLQLAGTLTPVPLQPAGGLGKV